MEYNKNKIYTRETMSPNVLKLTKPITPFCMMGNRILKDAILTSFCGKPCLWYAWSSKYHSKSENIKCKATVNVLKIALLLKSECLLLHTRPTLSSTGPFLCSLKSILCP